MYAYIHMFRGSGHQWSRSSVLRVEALLHAPFSREISWGYGCSPIYGTLNNTGPYSIACIVSSWRSTLCLWCWNPRPVYASLWWQAAVKPSCCQSRGKGSLWYSNPSPWLPGICGDAVWVFLYILGSRVSGLGTLVSKGRFWDLRELCRAFMV